MPHELEVRVRMQVRDIVLRAREEVVDAQDIVARIEQAVAKVGAKEARPTGHHHPFAHVVTTSH